MRLGRPLLRILTYASLVLVLSTCDMANVLSNPEQRKIALVFEGDSTLIMASGARPTIHATVDGAPIIDPDIRLTSSDTTIVAISASGDSLIARRLGRATITASLEGTLLPSPQPSASDTIYVVPKEFTLDRTSVTLTALGDTVRFVATATDALNRAIPNLGVVWTSSDTEKAPVSTAGLVTAKANTGTPVTITAQIDGMIATAELSVAQEIARFSFQPSTITFDALGAQATVSVSALDRNDNVVPELPSIAWTSGNAAIVSVHPANGTLVSLDTGRTYIRATATSGLVTISDTVHVEVNQQATRVTILATSGTALGAIGAKLQLDGRAYDRLNAEVKKAVSWSTLDGDIAGVDANGVVTARGIGTARILARVDTATSIQTVTVTNDPARLSLNPTAATLASVNDSLFIVLTAFNGLDMPIASPSVTWRSTDSTIVKVLAPGLVRAERAGTANIIVSSGTLSASMSVNVTNAPAFLDIALANATLASIGDSLAPAISLRNARGDELDRTSVTWSTDLSRIADVSVTGVIYALDSGSTKIRASSGSLRDSILITVTNAPASIVLNRSSNVLTAIGQTLSYSAEVRNAAGNEIPGFRVTWRSSDPAVATISSTGVATAVGVGTVQITGQAGAVSASASLVVTNEPASVTVAPQVASLTSVGDAIQLTASVTNAVGATVPGASVTWSTPDGAIATLSATGLLTSTAVGQARVIATSGGHADTAVVTISNSPDQVNIVPTEATLGSVNDSLVPALEVTNARGAALDASSLLWTSDDIAVARVTATGTIIATGSGATFIKAVSPTNVTRRDSILITVTNAPATLVLNDTRDTLTALGRSRTYTATVRNARGARLADAIVDWQSSQPTVASVIDGTVVAEGVGATIITAQSGTASATIDLTVTNDPVSLDLQPATLAITSLEDVIQLSATARNDLGNLVTSASLAWSSTIPSVASVDATGKVTGVAVGTARVIVATGPLADTTVVTVTNNPATIDIVPDTIRLLFIPESIAPAATLANSRGVALPRTSATWAADDPTVVRVSSSGMITARDTGITTVRATSGSVTDRVVVVVTNAPSAVVLSAERDTLTAAGQTIGFSASVTNLDGREIENAGVVWSSTNGSVATVTGSQKEASVTAVGFGSTLIIAAYDGKADTIRLAVVNPTVIYVDNSVFSTLRTGTSSRPYARIQDGVNAASNNDTVLVRKGSAPYDETVGLSRRIFLLGDSTAFTRSAPNPLELPLIAHDTGTAAITAYTSSSQVIRFFRITHSTDGATIDARGPNIQIGHVFVNFGEPATSGSGIVVDNATTGAGARVDSSVINRVRGYGVRFNGVVGGVIRQVSVSGVDSVPGTSGAGIAISGGSGAIVDSVNIRGTGGAQVDVQQHSSAALSRMNLSGRHQLLRLTNVTGNTQVSTSRFDMQLRGDESFSTGSAQDGRSGVRIDASSGVTLHDNVFVDANFGAMDGVYIVDSRGSGVLTASDFGATLLRNQFTGGRYNVRSARSSWFSEATRSSGAVRAVSGEDADIISMFADTIGTASSGCVVVEGAASAVTIVGGSFSVCAGGATTTTQAAVRAAGAMTSVSLDSSTVTGPNTMAVEHDGGGTVTVTRSVIAANGVRTLARTGTRSVIGSANASSVTITSNRVRGHADVAGVHIPSAASATVTSNHFSRNRVGVRVAAGAMITGSGNDWFDNDSAGVAYTGATASLNNNFWGDARGPKRATAPTATGDSALGTPLPTVFMSAPTSSGTVAAELRAVRGQTTLLATANPTATARVVDANGLPVAGVTVSFTCQAECGTSGGNAVRLETSPDFGVAAGGNQNTRTVVTNAAGLAEVLVDLRGQPKTTIISASAPGMTSVTISVTGQ